MNNELIVANNPKSGVAEAIKTIRTNLLFSSIDEPVKSILMTSSMSGEGKSFVSANLAVAFAQAGVNYKKYIKKTRYENIYVLPMGIVPPNPSELLASAKNKQLVKLLKQKFDLVIYDGVPVGGLTDSIIMADLVDKIVIVSAYKITPVEFLANTNKALEKFKDKIAGVILNKFPSSKDHYYSKYYS